MATSVINTAVVIKEARCCLHLIWQTKIWRVYIYCHHTANKLNKLKFTLVVNEDVTIKPVSEQQDILRVFKVDVCSGEQVWVKTVDREEKVTDTFRNKRKAAGLTFTSGPLEKTQNSQKEGVDLDVLPAGLLTDLVEVFEAPPIISLDWALSSNVIRKSKQKEWAFWNMAKFSITTSAWTWHQINTMDSSAASILSIICIPSKLISFTQARKARRLFQKDRQHFRDFSPKGLRLPASRGSVYPTVQTSRRAHSDAFRV